MKVLIKFLKNIFSRKKEVEDSDIDEEEKTEFLFECDDKGVECLQCQKCDGWFAPCEEGLKVNLRQKETGIMVKCNFKSQKGFWRFS